MGADDVIPGSTQRGPAIDIANTFDIVDYSLTNDGSGRVELRHLRYFCVVAEELHFGRAAAKLSLSQPSLSVQIRQLEEIIGAKLFERHSRKVGSPTQAACCSTLPGASSEMSTRPWWRRGERTQGRPVSCASASVRR